MGVFACRDWAANRGAFTGYGTSLNAQKSRRAPSSNHLAGVSASGLVSSIVILFGAQLNSEIEHQNAKDSTVERARPLGARAAVMADTVGEAVA
jgi:membrane protein